jgi:hypothetical protein
MFATSATGLVKEGKIMAALNHQNSIEEADE